MENGLQFKYTDGSIWEVIYKIGSKPFVLFDEYRCKNVENGDERYFWDFEILDCISY